MEPERKIEKWLRAFAKKRREQAGEPMELRPAARQRLQREIARQSEETNRGGLFAFFFGPRLKLAFTVCFLTLAVGAWFLWPQLTRQQPATLSMNKGSYQDLPPQTAAPAATPPSVTSPTIAGEDKKVRPEKQQSAPAAPPSTMPTVASANRALTVTPPGTPRERDRAEGTAAAAQKQLSGNTTAASAPSTNPQLAFKNETVWDASANAGAPAKDADGAFPAATLAQESNVIAGPTTNTPSLQTAYTLQRATAASNSTGTALFDLAKATGAATVSQVFHRLDASSTRRVTTGAAKAPTPVLTSFRVEQNGNNLKVVDADGSVYTGSVQIAQQEPPAADSFAAANNAPAAAYRFAKKPAPAQQNYFFRVAGTNQNSQNVIFSGNFVPFTNDQLSVGTSNFGGISAQGGGGGSGGGGSVQTTAQPAQAVLSNFEINGNVVIDDQKAVNVIAAPAR